MAFPNTFIDHFMRKVKPKFSPGLEQYKLHLNLPFTSVVF